MTFSAKQKKQEIPNIPVEIEVSTNQENTNDPDNSEDLEIDFLTPKSDVKKEFPNNIYQEELIKKSSNQTTLKTLNAIKIVSPIISALIESSKAQENDEQLSMLFKKLILEISDTAEKSCTLIGIDPKKERNAWVRNVLEKHLSEFAKQSLLSHSEVYLDKFLVLLPTITEFSTDCAEKEPFEDISPTSLIQLANIKAIMPIMSQSLSNFDLFRNFNNDVEDILNHIHKTVAKATIVLADEYANEKNRAQLYYLLMQEAGTIYATCWKTEVSRIQKIMTSPSEKVQQSIDKYKQQGGFPLNKINDDFSTYFQRFVVISQKLTVATKKANLATRVKKQ